MASGDSKKDFLRRMILFVVNHGWSQTAKRPRPGPTSGQAQANGGGDPLRRTAVVERKKSESFTSSQNLWIGGAHRCPVKFGRGQSRHGPVVERDAVHLCQQFVGAKAPSKAGGHEDSAPAAQAKACPNWSRRMGTASLIRPTTRVIKVNRARALPRLSKVSSQRASIRVKLAVRF